MFIEADLEGCQCLLFWACRLHRLVQKPAAPDRSLRIEGHSRSMYCLVKTFTSDGTQKCRSMHCLVSLMLESRQRTGQSDRLVDSTGQLVSPLQELLELRAAVAL